LVNKSGRIEKSIDAHKGAITVGRWSTDGSALLTGILTCYLKNFVSKHIYNIKNTIIKI